MARTVRWSVVVEAPCRYPRRKLLARQISSTRLESSLVPRRKLGRFPTTKNGELLSSWTHLNRAKIPHTTNVAPAVK